MRSGNSFQTGALIVFGAGIIIAIAIFAVTKARTGAAKPVLVVWGMQTADEMLPVLQSYDNSDSPFRIQYVPKREDAFDSDFVTALANGSGPDAVIIPDRLFLERASLYYTIPFESYPQRTFLDAFVDEGQSLLAADGVRAIPLAVDPLVMYWNRDLFSAAGVIIPPKAWDEFNDLAPKISSFDSTLRLKQSVIALGDMSNVPHSKELMLALWKQAGGIDFSPTSDPAAAALSSSVSFFTGFVDPTKKSYSWNHSLPSARDAFLAGTLATYFGYASELPDLQKKNANLNFDIAYLPQALDASRPTTYGAMSIFAIVKSTQHLPEAFALGVSLSSKEGNEAFSKAIGIPPMRRDLLSAPGQDAFSPIVFGSAIRARGWLDPNPAETDAIFERMVGAVVSGQSTADDAAQRAGSELSDIFGKLQPESIQ